MNNVVNQFLTERATLPLPKIARTRSGIEFTPDAAKWRFRDGTIQISMNFSLLPEACAPMLPGLKKTLIWYFENRSPRTANGNFVDFLWLLRQLTNRRDGVIEQISPEDIAAINNLSKQNEYRLAAVRGFLAKWSQLGVPGVGKDITYALKRLTPKQSPVGVAVTTLDPEKGPLTDLEFEAIQVALNNAYAQGQIDTEHLLLCYLLMALGVRPVQLASLKCSDLVVPGEPTGDYLLKVPRAKQREQLERSEFKVRKLTRQIGDPLAAHVQNIQAEFADRLQDVCEAPLFPQRKRKDDMVMPGFEYHSTSHSLTYKAIAVFAKLRVPSERLEGAIPVSAIRLRRTFATRAAEEGWPQLVLAELMDHSDIKNVEIYVGLTSRIRAEFSRKIAMDMAPLALAFAGKIIRSEDESIRPGPASRIIDLRVDRSGASMGSCGSNAHCGFVRPVACYGGCYDFEPWLDGPHEAALDYMLARRELLIATTDSRIAAINDRAILGCAQVILHCRKLLAKINHD